MDETMEKGWRALSEAVLSGMKAWRFAHPNATFRESEDAVHERVSRLEARMVQETVLTDARTDWAQAPAEQRPTCPNGRTALVSRGKRPQELPSRGGQTITWKRSSATGPTCGRGLFPLDEKRALSPGSLVPSQEEHLVHLATWMPFERAGHMLHALTGVQVSEATVRRHPEERGQNCEAVQHAQDQEAAMVSTDPERVPEQMVMRADGASVP